MPTGYFDRVQKLHTMADVDLLLAKRKPQANSDDKQTDGRDQQSNGGLVWSEPQKGLGFVFIDSGPYRITRQNKKYECHRDSYYLGSCNTGDEAKQLCATHFAAQTQSVKT